MSAEIDTETLRQVIEEDVYTGAPVNMPGFMKPDTNMIVSRNEDSPSKNTRGA